MLLKVALAASKASHLKGTGYFVTSLFSNPQGLSVKLRQDPSRLQFENTAIQDVRLKGGHLPVSVFSCRLSKEIVS
jgi:hypothetical protein